jgi:hypothetical protein
VRGEEAWLSSPRTQLSFQERCSIFYFLEEAMICWCDSCSGTYLLYKDDLPANSLLLLREESPPPGVGPGIEPGTFLKRQEF